MRNYQKGVGLMEVLVAIVLLAIAVLGFTALQLKALAASIDAGNHIQATNLAQDLSERIRVNRDGFTEFTKTADYTGITSPRNCIANSCSSQQLAQFDFSQVKNKAIALGMQIALRNCQNSTLKRKCVYVAWDKTTPTNGSADTDCTNGTAYKTNAKCIIMELYNYD